MSVTGTLLRPVTAGDGAGLWALLEPSQAEVIGMSSLPGNLDAARLLCEETSSTIADLATGSFSPVDGRSRRVVFVAVERTVSDDGTERSEEILGITGVTFKQAVPNLAVTVTTSKDGQGLIMSSSSARWTRTELDSSFIGPSARGKRLGTLLSRGRFMLLHLVRSQIPQTVASHLRGRFDGDGSAPFWRCFGARFAPQWATSTDAELALLEDPTRLDGLAGHRSPVTATVLESLGPVNAASLPAYHLLSAEGMAPNGMYDPIDGGPTVVAELSDTVTGRTRTHGRAVIGANPSVDALVSVATVDNFRVTRTDVGIPNSTEITLGAGAAAVLGVSTDSLLTAAGLVAPNTAPDGEVGGEPVTDPDRSRQQKGPDSRP
ncbi:MAG: arginine N-succinyltransferase [Actinomycetota bacterium]